MLDDSDDCSNDVDSLLDRVQLRTLEYDNIQ